MDNKLINGLYGIGLGRKKVEELIGMGKKMDHGLNGIRLGRSIMKTFIRIGN